jgi:hypothetical protein
LELTGDFCTSGVRRIHSGGILVATETRCNTLLLFDQHPNVICVLAALRMTRTVVRDRVLIQIYWVAIRFGFGHLRKLGKYFEVAKIHG